MNYLKRLSNPHDRDNSKKEFRNKWEQKSTPPSPKRVSFTPARNFSASNEPRLPLRGTSLPQTSAVYLCAVLLCPKRASFTPARYFSASNERRLALRGTSQPQTSLVYPCAEPRRVKKALLGRFTQGKKQRDGHLIMPD
jgi:hypothetical protein